MNGARSESVGRAFRIVLVEDHVELAEVTRHVLTRRGHTVFVCRTARDALDAVLLHAPECALIDLRLPDMTGVDLARALRKERLAGNVRLVALSADVGRSRNGSRLDDPFDAVLTKPLDPDGLESWLRDQLEP